VTDCRAPLFASETTRTLLGDCFRECQERWSFEVDAIVLLPDHLHTIWSLPPGDSIYSTRWSWLKKEFAKHWLAAGAIEFGNSKARRSGRATRCLATKILGTYNSGRGHFERHFDYIHYNPVKHGYVKCPHDWPHSSFHRWVKAGVYPLHWGGWRKSMTFEDIIDTVGE